MDFHTMITEERTRLNQKIKDLTKQKTDIDRQIAEVNTELDAITAYENAKLGKKPRSTGVRQMILDTLREHPQGLRRADILAALNTEHKEQSVSNAILPLNPRTKGRRLRTHICARTPKRKGYNTPHSAPLHNNHRSKAESVPRTHRKAISERE